MTSVELHPDLSKGRSVCLQQEPSSESFYSWSLPRCYLWSSPLAKGGEDTCGVWMTENDYKMLTNVGFNSRLPKVSWGMLFSGCGPSSVHL
jgi:hypothetical protein